MPSGPTPDRRALLAGTAGTLAAASGCVGGLRTLVGRERRRQLSLSIATLPANHDPGALGIANHLRETLTRAGVDASVEPMAPEALLRAVLVNQQFDLFVAQYPSRGRPDELRTLLHSAYGEEAGWQNPFGFSSVAVDDMLDRQRTEAGEDRGGTVRQLQDRTVELQPFTVVAFGDRIAAARTDRFAGWPPGGPTDLTDYLDVERTEEADELRPVITDVRPTRNLNPIAVEYRDGDPVTPLLYEPLVRRLHGKPTPWLARSIRWTEGPLSAAVTLRETTWHDETPLTGDDVAFTYEFLADTSLGEFDSPVPTPWRRGAASLVESATVREGGVELTFDTPNRAIARRALEVPILPAHVWREFTGRADVAGIDIVGGTTEALVRPNEPPVGSGPLAFESATDDQSVTLSAFEGHFLARGDTEGLPEPLASQPVFDRAAFTVAPSEEAVAELLDGGDADVTGDDLHPDTVPSVSRSDDVSLFVDRSPAFYLVGYNCRRQPLSNQRFRRVVARHLDREHLVSTAFRDYARPAEVPMPGRWTPPALRWSGTARLAFLGEDGELTVAAARDAFREAGYSYEDDRLVTRGDG
jgi:peptide/nickel transport system substrate-binding protein